MGETEENEMVVEEGERSKFMQFRIRAINSCQIPSNFSPVLNTDGALERCGPQTKTMSQPAFIEKKSKNDSYKDKMNSALNHYWMTVYNERKQKIEESVDFAFPGNSRNKIEAKNKLL
jgi:hypothetical protein